MASSSFSSYVRDMTNWPRSTANGAMTLVRVETYDDFTSEMCFTDFQRTLQRESPLRYRLSPETTKQIYQLHYQYDRGCILFPEHLKDFECFSSVIHYHIAHSFLPSIHDDSMNYVNCSKLCLLCYSMRRGMLYSLFSNSDDSSDSDRTLPVPSRDHKVSFDIRHFRYFDLLYDLYLLDCFWCDSCYRPLFKTYAILEGAKSDQIYPEKDSFLFLSYISRNANYHLFPSAVTDITRVSCKGMFVSNELTEKNCLFY